MAAMRKGGKAFKGDHSVPLSKILQRCLPAKLTHAGRRLVE